MPATIKLFLIHGDAKRLRTAEIINWSGKAIAAPRTELDELLVREEANRPGVYFLLGVNPETGKPSAYIGEAEIIRDRLKQHQGIEFWNSVIVFVGKDENLTKSHIRYLEGELIKQARNIDRFEIKNGQGSGAHLPESDRADMEAFLDRIHQLLPVLGADLLVPIVPDINLTKPESLLLCKINGLIAKGRITPNGFVVYKSSQAVLEHRPSAKEQHPYVVDLRERLIAEGDLERRTDHFVFTKDIEFTSPSAAASVIRGGGDNGLIQWKDQQGKKLKDIEFSKG